MTKSINGKRVLVLCTGNSARSILTEALLNHLSGGRFLAFSAGSRPTGKVNSLAIETLQRNGIPVGNPRSKSWDEFARVDSGPIDIVITVCSNAAGEACPVWPGHPLTAHWGVDDPATVDGTLEQKLAAFQRAFAVLEHRVQRLVASNVESLDDDTLKQELDLIGISTP